MGQTKKGLSKLIKASLVIATLGITVAAFNSDVIFKLTEVPLEYTQVSSSVGSTHTLAIDTNGNLWAWGNNREGQLGNGGTTNSNIPIQVKSGTKFSQILAGAVNSFGIDTDGNLWQYLLKQELIGNHINTSP